MRSTSHVQTVECKSIFVHSVFLDSLTATCIQTALTAYLLTVIRMEMPFTLSSYSFATYLRDIENCQTLKFCSFLWWIHRKNDVKTWFMYGYLILVECYSEASEW